MLCCRRRIHRSTCRPTTRHRSPTGASRSGSTTPGTAVPGRRPMPATTTSSARSCCASSSRTRLLLDTRGNVVYSAYKGVDLGTNILTGPYREGATARRLREGPGLQCRRLRRRHRLRRSTSPPTSPPPGWCRRSRLEGRSGRRSRTAVPDLQDQPGDDADRQREAAGMGRTGETFLVGPGRPDAVGLANVPGGSRGVQARRRRRRNAAGRRRGRRSARAAPPWCSRWRARRPAWPARPARHRDRRRLPRAANAAGLRTGPT